MSDHIGSTQELLDFLLERRLHGDLTWVGMSSEAMVDQAITGADLPGAFPHDEHDLARCEETYRRAPEFLKRRMVKTLELFRRGISEGGLYCRGCDTFGHHYTVSMRCKACVEKDPELKAAEEARQAWLDGLLARRGTKKRSAA